MDSLSRLLGGRAVLGMTPKNERDLIALVREGLPYESFERVARGLETSLNETAEALKLSRRSLSRRKETKERLTHEESERVLRLARTAVRAAEVLGSLEKAYHWLRRSNRALGGKAPLSLLDVDIGARAVEQVLGRIQHGVYG